MVQLWDIAAQYSLLESMQGVLSTIVVVEGCYGVIYH